MTVNFSDRQFQNQLRAKIDEEHQTRAGQLTTGLASTVEDYRGRVEYLRALRDVLSWSDDITALMNHDPKRAT